MIQNPADWKSSNHQTLWRKLPAFDEDGVFELMFSIADLHR
jgi:hypothetical protein